MQQLYDVNPMIAEKQDCFNIFEIEKTLFDCYENFCFSLYLSR